ncbi:MAG TPA: hypothetical protein VFF76_04140 [Holophagaceae bacterium]|jgi:hypothetical protein|nr:hypothetical protein [Holophagaceae bacterium]
MPDSRSSLTRWLGALVAALAFLLWLAAMAGLYIRYGVVNHFISEGVRDPATVKFTLHSFFMEILPLYAGVGFLLFVLQMAALKALRIWTPAKDSWTFRHAFWMTLGLLGLVHCILWWRVPTTLWVMLGINLLPLGFAPPLLFALSGLAMVKGLSWSETGKARKGLSLMTGAFLAWGSLWIPQRLEQAIWTPDRPVGHPAKVLMISLDGLRQDTAMEMGFDRAHGFKSFNAYAAIPATRLEWSIIWGGDPRSYSVGNLFPSLDEFEGKAPYQILDLMKQKGLKARFYIDDGGTVGLTDRADEFDEIGMPASGWENFLNSNLAVHIPLYAAWMNVLRVFPTTTPWTPLDLGLKAALGRGRGADWVMYHSCLAHQPIFLTREELAAISGWWKLPIGRMAPHFETPPDQVVAAWRPEYNPFLAYRIRVKRILDQWIQLWDTLPSDPDYGAASRFLMTDHGERFYHATEEIQFGGVHGYGLDPWEARIPLCLDGPGVETGIDDKKAISLLAVRDAIVGRILEDKPIRPSDLLSADDAPMRMHGLNFSVRPDDPKDYREMDPHEFVEGVRVLPGGAWFMKYKKSPEEREQDLTYAEANGRILKVFRPLKQGGCRLFVYDGYDQVAIQQLDEAAFDRAKATINERFLRPWDAKATAP